MTNDSQNYNIAAIRELLLAAFTTDDLRRFLLYTPNKHLKPLRQQFSPGDGLEAMAEKAIVYCQTRSLLSDLLEAVEEANPRTYAHFASRLVDTSPDSAERQDTPTPTPVAQSEKRTHGNLLQGLRDPVWQGVAALIAIVALAVAFGTWFWPDIRSTLFPTPTSETPTDSISSPSPSPTSLTPAPTTPPPPTPVPFFSDDFCSKGIDFGFWDILDPGLYTDDSGNCHLVANYSNETSPWGEQRIWAKLGGKRFLTIEFVGTVLDASQVAKIGIETSCNDQSLFLELKGDGRIKGYTEEKGTKDYVYFYPLSFEQPYTIRLVQKTDAVHVFVNGTEMENHFPCANMGQRLTVGAGAESGHHIHGSFEYIRLWSDAIEP